MSFLRFLNNTRKKTPADDLDLTSRNSKINCRQYVEQMSQNMSKQFDEYKLFIILSRHPELLKELDREIVTKIVRKTARNILTEITQLIKKFGANLHPLETALIQSDTKSADLILRLGEKFEGPEWNGFSPGDYIFIRENIRHRKEMLMLLVKYGLTEFRNDSGENLLHVLAATTDEEDFDAVEIAEILIDSGLNINEADKKGYTPLFHAIFTENISLVSFFIKKGASLDTKDNHERTPLFHANRLEFLEIVDLLLSNGADVNVKDKYGWTPMHLACYYHCDRTISLLARKGADVNVETSDGKTPFFFLNPENMNYKFCLVEMIKEFSKLMFQGKLLIQSDMNLIAANPVAQEHLKKCKDELELMAKTNFHENYSYYSVLTRSIRVEELADLTNNDGIVPQFKANIRNFFYFENDLIRIFEESVQVRDEAFASRKISCSVM